MTAFELNGALVAPKSEPDTPLLWVLRGEMGQTGTKFGCGAALCGACTVHLNGEAIRSCVTPLSVIPDGASVTTIEGLADAYGDALRAAWLEADVVQCGYCQPGQLMSAAALLRRTTTPTDQDIDIAMSGNVCRCGTYPRIRAAIKAAGAALAAAKPASGGNAR